VCLGNICRSPLAEGIFLHMVRERGIADRFRVDSAGTGGWHIGALADPRMRATASRRGVELVSRARQVAPAIDFLPGGPTPVDGFDLILAMDRANRRDLLAVGAPAERVRLFRSFDPAMQGRPEKELDVPDPYHGDDDGFARVYEIVWAASAGLVEAVVAGGARAHGPK
jgi:protein-tyrosine phosphatase